MALSMLRSLSNGERLGPALAFSDAKTDSFVPILRAALVFALLLD
jgi:hypothetical protein